MDLFRPFDVICINLPLVESEFFHLAKHVKTEKEINWNLTFGRGMENFAFVLSSKVLSCDKPGRDKFLLYMPFYVKDNDTY